MNLRKFVPLLGCVLITSSAFAASIKVPMQMVTKDQQGKPIGTITITEIKTGLLLRPNLRDLPPGHHGFHIHQNPSCADGGMAAGDHLDPHATGKHLGPYNPLGHLGDLPFLEVNEQGKAKKAMLAPRLRLSEVKGHSLMIHESGDNYSDQPKKLGGGGARIACGVIPEE